MDGYIPHQEFEGLIFCFGLIAVLNTIAILCAVIMTIYASAKQFAMRGLVIYWWVTLIVLFICLVIGNENGLYLYAFMSPALLLLLSFHKRFNSK